MSLQARIQAFKDSLTPAEQEQYEAMRKQRESMPESMSFEAFKRQYWRKYQRAQFDTLLDTYLAQVAEYVLTEGASGIARLAVFAPPRHGKSYRISRMFPAWMFAQKPDLRAIIASYGQSLSEAHSRAIRNLIEGETYRQQFPKTRLATTNLQQWDTTAGGSLIAGSVGGALVGHGGSLILIDDPVKSRQEAESATLRERAREWYNNDLLSRLEEPGGAIVLMATRYHQDDLSGYLLNDEDSDEWTVLTMPALAEENDPLGREIGAALWPEKYPVELLEKRRAKMGEYAWSSLYQQHPQAKGAGSFDTQLIEVLEVAPECKRVVRFYDLAVSGRTSKRTDYSVGLKLGVTHDERFIVLDVWRRQLSPADVAKGIKQNAAIDGTGCRIRLEAENSARVQLDFLLRDPDLRAYTIDSRSPVGDKFTRAQPVAARAMAGRLAIVRAGWNRAFLDELAMFPQVDHDDQTDALSGAYDMLATVVLALPFVLGGNVGFASLELGTKQILLPDGSWETVPIDTPNPVDMDTAQARRLQAGIIN